MNAQLTRVLLVSVCLSLAALAGAQQPPQLSKDQRTLLQAVIAAVDAAGSAPETEAAAWQTHLLRASDGSHYVAFSVAGTADRPIAATPLITYVRLATTPAQPATTLAERSAVREWLAGSRLDPRLLPRHRGFAVGEMPAMGAAAGMTRGGVPAVGSADLQALGLEQERNRQRKEDQERQRRAALEGTGQTTSQLLPFEDFDVLAPAAFADGTPAIQRALTTGPGRYYLSVAWVEASAKPGKAAVRVARRSIELPPATSGEFGLSSVILADRVGVREVPYTALEQRAHPYAIGPTEIMPARDAVFTRDDRISVAFQIVNPRANDTGKPDIAVNFRIVRLIGEREESVATLSPLRYDATTLPPEFDVRLGHPVIAAMSAPLATLPRGAYRLKIVANDRIAGTARAADTDFLVVGTPLSLLSEAPALAPPFRRDALLDPAILRHAIEALTPPSPSPALTRALTAAASGKLIDLLLEEPLPAEEQGVRAALTGLALYSVGDASATVHFQRALQLNAPAGPVQFWIGAARAAQAREPDAIAAWQSAIGAGMRSSLVGPFLVDAHLRRSDGARASALVAAELGGRPAEGSWIRAAAASHIATARDAEAIAVLEKRLAQQPDDREAQWLLLHALYASLVRTPAGATAANLDRFTKAAQEYVAAGGAHAPLVTEWLKATEAK
jgi:hypothetical protein